MFMRDDKKGAVSVIMSKLKGSENPDAMKDDNASNVGAAMAEVMEPNKEEGADDVGLESAAEEMMEAFKTGDTKSLMEALKAFMSMYK